MNKVQLLKQCLLFASFFLFACTCFSQVSQQWVARYNGAANGTDIAYHLALDPTGNVYVTGSSRVSETNTDYTTAKYDASGNQLWVKTYNGTGNAFDAATGIATDANGNVYVIGNFRGKADFDPGPGTYFLKSSCPCDESDPLIPDVFFAKYSGKAS